MKQQTFYFWYSVFVAAVPALALGGLVSRIDRAAGLAIGIGLFGWVFTNLLIRRPK